MTTFSGADPAQNNWELTQLVDFIRTRECRRYLEVGTRHGDTFHYLMPLLPAPAYALGIDLPEAPWGRPQSRANMQRVMVELTAAGYNCEMRFGSSQDPETIEFVRARGPFDMTLIDADHTYAAVSADFRNYSTMSRFVAFHDIAGEGKSCKFKKRRLPIDVPKLWAQLKPKFPHWEFIAPDSRMGIGVVETGA